jgi:hypothetical protein
MHKLCCVSLRAKSLPSNRLWLTVKTRPLHCLLGAACVDPRGKGEITGTAPRRLGKVLVHKLARRFVELRFVYLFRFAKSSLVNGFSALIVRLLRLQQFPRLQTEFDVCAIRITAWPKQLPTDSNSGDAYVPTSPSRY